MKVHILTIFPEIFSGFLSTSLISKAHEKNLISISIINIRDFSSPPHYQVDDTPYGGGAGMTMKPEPLYAAITKSKNELPLARVYLMSPRGKIFKQESAIKLSKESEIIFVCGRYEGVDERVIELCVDEEISIGDFVLMGGEVAAMAVLEASTRLLEGVLGNKDSLSTESFCGDTLLEAPQYTRPPLFENMKVPEILLSGNHSEIEKWRKEQSRRITKERRPDLLK